MLYDPSCHDGFKRAARSAGEAKISSGTIAIRTLLSIAKTKGVVMTDEKKDVATLIELLKMEAERWPHSEIDQMSESELFRRDCLLLEMWPEACRRAGVGRREFPAGVIELWKQRMGVAN